jgi:ABC-type antimicrobial peptide transport system permease subunit
MLFEALRVMWSNYIILIIRRPKSWGGITIANLLGQVVVYALLLLLINSFLSNVNIVSLVAILSIMLVAAIAYTNYITLQLKKRLKEFYVRKLLGAEDREIRVQLIIESIILTTFLAISGVVFTEFVSPWCGEYLGINLSLISQPLYLQLAEVSALVIPIGFLAALIPIRNFLGYVNKNFVKLSRHPR